MTYELAKELKDAGFLQRNEYELKLAEEYGGINPGYVKRPNLSELIKACGSALKVLRRLDGDRGWAAISEFRVEPEIRCERESPEEAVARFWLALNKIRNDMKKLHLVYIPWTGVGLHGGFRSNDWYAHRIKIFKNYTLKSLANQSNKNFVLWCSFRPEERLNPLTSEIAEAIKESGLRYVFTFNGLMYWDDKFNHYGPRAILRNFLMMLWDCYIYRKWTNPLTILKYTWENKNRTLPKRIANSLEELRQTIDPFNLKEWDWVYMTRLDSDDMFHQEAVNLIQSQEPVERRSLVFDKGYILNIQTGQVADWNPPTNPPFHTIVFPAHVFFEPRLYLEYYRGFRSHEDATRCFDPIVMDMHQYMVSFHGKHISTDWDSPLPKRIHHAIKYKGYCYTTSGRNISTHWESRTGHVRNFMIGREYLGEEKKLILSDFGVCL